MTHISQSTQGKSIFYQGLLKTTNKKNRYSLSNRHFVSTHKSIKIIRTLKRIQHTLIGILKTFSINHSWLFDNEERNLSFSNLLRISRSAVVCWNNSSRYKLEKNETCAFICHIATCFFLKI